MITGFIEKQDKIRLKSSESKRCFQTLASPAIRSYIQAETKLQRLVRIDNPQALFDPTEIVMSRCLALKKPEKDEYRFVYDNTCCNEFILPTGCFQNGPISFTTPSIETLLRSPIYLEKIKSSKTALIFDATAYYRQIFTHRSAWNLSMFQTTNGKTYLDITSRMGHVNSSLSAQRVSDLKDWLFNNSQPYAGIGLTNQDDCIIIDSNGHSEQKFRHFAENLGIAINESKNQAGSVVTWCGYDLDLAKQSIKIRKKRIEKLKLVAKEIINSSLVKRKMIAIFLGSVHSCRPIILGQWKFTSPLLFFTRKSTFLFENIYEDGVIDSEWYQELVTVNDFMRVEIQEALDLVIKEVEIQNAADGLNRYLSIDQLNGCYEGCNLVFSDASQKFWGVTLKIGPNQYAFSGRFDDFIVDNWSIYLKEYYGCVMAKLLFLYVNVSLGNSTSKTVHFIDNTGAKTVLPRKVSLKSLEIGILAKFNQLISNRLQEKNWSYIFIDSESNRWADYCTREGVHRVCNITSIGQRFCPFTSLLSGVLSSSFNVKYLVSLMIKNLNL